MLTVFVISLNSSWEVPDNISLLLSNDQFSQYALQLMNVLIILLVDCVWSEVLATSLNKPQTNK